MWRWPGIRETRTTSSRSARRWSPPIAARSLYPSTSGSPARSTNSFARRFAELGRADIAVANAGIARAVPLEQLDDDAWYATVDVDLTGVWRLFRAVLPHMRRAHYGRLIATASISGIVSAWQQHPQYAAAKAGIVGLVHNLAVEYGPDGITANAVAPGVIKTPQSLDPVNSLGPEGVAATGPRVPLRRVATPEDIAYLYCFLASMESEYVTGQLIVADGGGSFTGLG
jgi:3-oxoacyl-[acyl-carrier protein] reductase